mmetsp:Transcript_48419/g.121231  ORF Transcript_48419/g.121231 Transcript_48419/m.121231 type:complete len:133 (+) Transcript_48419:19-417(+)
MVRIQSTASCSRLAACTLPHTHGMACTRTEAAQHCLCVRVLMQSPSGQTPIQISLAVVTPDRSRHPHPPTKSIEHMKHSSALHRTARKVSEGHTPISSISYTLRALVNRKNSLVRNELVACSNTGQGRHASQ